MNPLLPSGFYDCLAPEAAREARLVDAVMGHFAAWGYQRVATPLMEFEETLLSGPGHALNRATFRVMDAVSHRMLGLRTDHTLQIGRVAATRLQDAARPLRLSYAGAVLRVIASERDPARQRTQAGIELIGTLRPEADAEAICLGFSALAMLGAGAVSVDLVLPTLVPALLDAAGLDAEKRKAIHHALDRKDEADLMQQAGASETGKTLLSLLRHSGEAAKALDMLRKLDLPEKAAADRARLESVIGLLGEDAKNATVDLVECRYFEYQTGLSFTFFSRAGQVEMGRGGRYRTQNDEPATGLTFYSDALMQVLPKAAEAPRLMVPFGLNAKDAARLQGEGFALVQALEQADEKTAKAQGCSHLLDGGKARVV